MKLPKAETLIIFVFFGCVALWAMSKCSAKRSDLVRRIEENGENETDERPARRDTVVVQQPAPQPVQQQPVNTQGPSPVPPPPVTTTAPANTPGAKPVRPSLSSQPAPTSAQSTGSTSSGSILYVTIDGLKVRKEPGLKGETVAKLALYEPVTFLNKKTEWTQEISLGYEKVTDHWVKIRTRSGKEGWVFGAGVHYYKMKRQGVME